MSQEQSQKLTAAEKRELLKKRLNQSVQAKTEVPPVIKAHLAADQEHLLSYAQLRLWLLDKIDGGGSHYNMPSALTLSGQLDVHALNRAFETIIERHECIRTVFSENKEGEPVQVIMEAKPFAVDITDLTDLPQQQQLVRVPQLASEAAETAFDLSVDLMLRVSLLKLAETEHVLILIIHHIASDGWSMGILVNEFNMLYSAFAQQQQNPLAPLQLQYSDYAYWQRHWLKGEVLDRQLDYWTKQLSDLPMVHSLPLDAQRPKIQGFEGDTYSSVIYQKDFQLLEQLCQRQGATLFMGLNAIFSVLLARYSNEKDIVVGTPIANREQVEIAPLIGFFMNTLVLRTDLSGDPSFNELIARNKKMLLDAYNHQQVPFEQIVEKLQPERSLSLTPLFQIMVVFHNNEKGEITLPGLELGPFATEGSVAKYDLTLHMSQTDDGLHMSWDYCRALFKPQTIKRMAGHFNLLFKALTGAPDQNVFEVNMLSSAERELHLKTWNNTALPYNKEQCIHQLFEQQAVRSPDVVALVCDGVEMTYAELNHKANRLAHYLVDHYQVKPDTLVGICMVRSLDMMVGLMAILKACGAYVPMDPGYPSVRLAHILEDSGIGLLLSQTDIVDMLPLSDNVATVCLDNDKWQTETPNDGFAPKNANFESNHLAYMIYTSGSTGKPKGVMVSHQNVVNFFAAMNHDLERKPGDNATKTWLAVTSISFDISVLELFWTLSLGDKIVIQPERPEPVDNHGPISFSLFYFAAEKARTKGNKYHLLLEGAKFADQNGLSAIWVPERHFASFGDQFPNPSVAAGAVAAVTENIAIRAGSVVLPLHDPIRVAEEWSMVDNLSNGRAQIAIASGWHPNDFVFAPSDYETRHQKMRDSLQTVQQLWQGKPIERKNGVGKTVEVLLHPAPVQDRLPIWVTAASAPETFEYAGSNGANILTHLLGHSLEDLQRKIVLYRDALERAGYDRNEGKVAMMLHTFVCDDPNIKEIVREPLKNYLRHSLHLIKPLIEGTELAASVDWEKDPEVVMEFAFERYFQSFGLFGSSQACQSKVDEFKAFGVDEVACLIDFGIEPEIVLDNLPCLAQLQQQCRHKEAREQLLAKRMDRQWSPLALIEQHDVTHMQCTPSFVSDWVNVDEGIAALNRLQMLLVGGEAIAAEVASKLVAQMSGSIYNMYGPTETTIWSAVEPITSDDVQIGLPLGNTQFYVLGPQLQLCPIGVSGELYIAGDAVTRGYYNRSELTAANYVDNPFSDNSDRRMYKTGDLVQRLDDGRLRFIGRVDHQIKLNGFRIELGEIEHHIKQFAGVDSCIVMVRGQADGIRSLVAYIKLAQTEKAPAMSFNDALRTHLASNIPDFMLPSTFSIIEKWPLTPNGKIDKNALPDLDLATMLDQHVMLETETEQGLAQIWCELLDRPVEEISAMGNFFNYGGHSLLSLRLVADICKRFTINIDVRSIFEAPVLRDMAIAIDSARLVAESAEVQDDEVEVQGWL